MNNCTEQNMTAEKIARFHSPECIWLCTTNADNIKHNRNQSQKKLRSMLKLIDIDSRTPIKTPQIA